MAKVLEKVEISDVDRAELQSHYPYMDVKLNELSVQEERLLLFHLRGMTKAAAGRAAGGIGGVQGVPGCAGRSSDGVAGCGAHWQCCSAC